LDYYLRTPSGEELYLFTREYSTTCYETCKSGAPINSILHGKKNNTAFMRLGLAGNKIGTEIDRKNG
jgi:hypothetical protein